MNRGDQRNPATICKKTLAPVFARRTDIRWPETAPGSPQMGNVSQMITIDSERVVGGGAIALVFIALSLYLHGRTRRGLFKAAVSLAAAAATAFLSPQYNPAHDYAWFSDPLHSSLPVAALIVGLLFFVVGWRRLCITFIVLAIPITLVVGFVLLIGQLVSHISSPVLLMSVLFGVLTCFRSFEKRAVAGSFVAIGITVVSTWLAVHYPVWSSSNWIFVVGIGCMVYGYFFVGPGMGAAPESAGRKLARGRSG